MMVLASCQDVAEEAGSHPGVAVQSGYPSLHSVPPRPQLSYSVEQQRAIVDGLIADRENARYSSQVVRFRTGLSSLPPPRTPPVTAAPPEPDVAGTGAVSATAGRRPVVAPETEFVYEGDDLNSFMEEMVDETRELPDGTAPATIDPQSNAAPLEAVILRAAATRAGTSAGAAHGRAPGVVWAIPVASADLPQAPRASDTANPQPSLPDAPREVALAGRAPGVVWAEPDTSSPAAVRSPAATAGRAADAATAPHGSPLPPTEAGSSATASADRAPGVVWARPDMPEDPIAPVTAARQVAAAVAPQAAAHAVPIEAANGHAPQSATAPGAPPAPEPMPPPSVGTAGIEVADGLVAIAVAGGEGQDQAFGAISFAPGSATLSADAAAQLERFLAMAKGPDVHIRVVGEGAAPALALDRALAVGLALVQGGIAADRLELTLAPDAAADQARLFLAASAP